MKKMFNNDEMAANVWLSKYAYDGETHPDQMFERMAKEIARVEDKYQFTEFKEFALNMPIEKLRGMLSQYGLHRTPLNEKSIFSLFKGFKYLIPQGSIMATLGTPVIASLSNCFVLKGAENSYGGIHRTDEEQTQLMKRRGGVGHDLSKLQPANTRVNNAAKTSTGAISFAHRFSESTREVAQNGRRGK